MGNSMTKPQTCFQQNNSTVKLIFYEGTIKLVKGRNIVAGEIMFEYPRTVVCHADSFFIGQPIPSLSIEDELMPGQTYFVLPIGCFACKDNILSTSFLSDFTYSLSRIPSAPINFGHCPFEYLKSPSGRDLIKVSPKFITSLISSCSKVKVQEDRDSFLCSTPELKKHFRLLVRSKEQTWSPQLETISEYKIRFSPCRVLGLEWKRCEK